MVSGATIEDWIAICETKARYCRFLDTKQWSAFSELFTEDVTLDVSEAGGPPPVKGRDNALALVRGSIETARTVHQVHSPEIEVEGSSAKVLWAMQDRVAYEDGKGLVGYGHYTERYEKRDGRWRIASLKLTRLHVDATGWTVSAGREIPGVVNPNSNA